MTLLEADALTKYLKHREEMDAKELEKINLEIQILKQNKQDELFFKFVNFVVASKQQGVKDSVIMHRIFNTKLLVKGIISVRNLNPTVMYILDTFRATKPSEMKYCTTIANRREEKQNKITDTQSSSQSHKRLCHEQDSEQDEQSFGKRVCPELGFSQLRERRSHSEELPLSTECSEETIQEVEPAPPVPRNRFHRGLSRRIPSAAPTTSRTLRSATRGMGQGTCSNRQLD